MPSDPEINLESMRVYITAGQAREFMRGIVQEEFIWRRLAQQDYWGGHLQRTILKVAVGDFDEDEKVDIVPIYVEENVQQPNGFNKNAKREEIVRDARTYLLKMLVFLDAEDEYETEVVPKDLEKAMYGSRTSKSALPPAVMFEFDEETNARIQDKYFYAHNGITGQRYAELKYPEYVDSPIPDPQEEN